VVKKTVLNETHRRLGARMVPFGGWEMPIHYGSQIEEHHAVRRDAGLFDVCHMTVVDVVGPQARPFLRHLLANDVARLRTPGKALYGCMLNAGGGVIDDLITYHLDEHRFRLVVNAATTDKDLEWMALQCRSHEVEVRPRHDLGMLAVQGPRAREKALPLLPESLRERAARMAPFNAAWDANWFVARTGYTGEDGFEIMVPRTEVTALWNALLEQGVRPCGLGARDTLRLEAGMNLYGQDMDEETSPLEAGLGWTLDLSDPERRFVGRDVVERQKEQGGLRRFTGLVLEGKGVLRNHMKLYEAGSPVGEITSGGYSPTLERAIGLARLDARAGEALTVEIRGRRLPVRLVKPPFVRHGKALIEL